MNKIKLVCYFAHPKKFERHTNKYRIKNILKERGVEVVDPFLGEYKMMRKIGIKDYWDKPDFKTGRDLWIKDLSEIRKCNLLVIWLPEPSIGVAAELQYGLEWQKRLRYQDQKKLPEEHRPYLIQIITKIKHPLIAYSLSYGNQQFETIKDFERLKLYHWD